jgi:hypothetical protein
MQREEDRPLAFFHANSPTPLASVPNASSCPFFLPSLRSLLCLLSWPQEQVYISRAPKQRLGYNVISLSGDCDDEENDPRCAKAIGRMRKQQQAIYILGIYPPAACGWLCLPSSSLQLGYRSFHSSAAGKLEALYWCVWWTRAQAAAPLLNCPQQRADLIKEKLLVFFFRKKMDMFDARGAFVSWSCTFGNTLVGSYW